MAAMAKFDVIQQLPFMDSSHLKKFLQDQPDALKVNYDGKSVLHHAILTGNLAVIAAILQHGGFSDAPHASGETPLLAACRMGQLWTVGQLVGAGADTRVRDQRGTGCVHAAAANGRLTVLQYLREVEDLPLTDPDMEGRTPLSLAAAGGDAQTVLYLISQARPSLSACDARGDTALHHAARGGHVHVCWLLLTRGGDQLLSVANADGQMPHQVADSKLGGYLQRVRRADGVAPSARLQWTAQLLRPMLTVLSALALCTLTPAPLSAVLNPAIVLMAAYLLCGQSHRLNHPSRQASPAAVGGVCALLMGCAGAAVLDMRSYLLVPAPLTVLSVALFAALSASYTASLRYRPAPAEPAADVAATLRCAAATLTGQTAYCPVCQYLWRCGRERHHCRLCNSCYPGYDHHCLYLCTCIATANRRGYLRLLLVSALNGVAFLCHVAAFVGSLPAEGRLAALLGRHIWSTGATAAVTATLFMLRALIAVEVGHLWSALPGGRWRRLHRLARYLGGSAQIAALTSHMESAGLV